MKHFVNGTLLWLAATTKQASSGPREVANMPAPQGHQVVTGLSKCKQLKENNITKQKP